jgi:hypothetical protein
MLCHLKRLLLGLAACSLAVVLAHADTVTGTGGWQSWSPAYLIQGVSPTPGTPYWNNLSGDGSRYNIGWCLVGNGNCSIPSPPGNVPYFGLNGGSASADFSFESSNYAVTATLEASFTNSRALDVFGWYSIDANGSIGLLHPLFSPSDSPGLVHSFTPSSTYGFYVEQDQGTPGNHFASQYFFFMDSAKNNVAGYPNPSDTLQHFAVFDAQLGTSDDRTPYYIGAVDTRACTPNGSGTCNSTARFDYNDFIVRLDTIDTPEPGSFGLLACTLVMLVAFLRPQVFRQQR